MKIILNYYKDLENCGWKMKVCVHCYRKTSTKWGFLTTQQLSHQFTVKNLSSQQSRLHVHGTVPTLSLISSNSMYVSSSLMSSKPALALLLMLRAGSCIRLSTSSIPPLSFTYSPILSATLGSRPFSPTISALTSSQGSYNDIEGTKKGAWKNWNKNSLFGRYILMLWQLWGTCIDQGSVVYIKRNGSFAN